MQLVQSQDVPLREGRALLLSGAAGRPDDYALFLQARRASAQAGPRRETFDQVWFDLAGEARYLPESTFYDPGELRSGTPSLLLQCGGASGRGYAPGAAGGDEDIEHPKPRYDAPVVMDVAGFDWIAARGLHQKQLGVFSERGLKIGLLRLAAGASTALAGKGAPRVLYALAGAGTVNGRPWREGAALGLGAAEAVTLQAQTPAEWFFVRLQRFDA